MINEVEENFDWIDAHKPKQGNQKSSKDECQRDWQTVWDFYSLKTKPCVDEGEGEEEKESTICWEN